jgi:hypothetical protein
LRADSQRTFRAGQADHKPFEFITRHKSPPTDCDRAETSLVDQPVKAPPADSKAAARFRDGEQTSGFEACCFHIVSGGRKQLEHPSVINGLPIGETEGGLTEHP